MKKWKIIIEYESKVFGVIIRAKSYHDAYINVEIKYPNCIVKSISESH